MKHTPILYKKAEDCSGLKKGDKVKIVFKGDNHLFGWKNSWSRYMNDNVNDGKIYTIAFIRSDATGVCLVENDYAWPFFCLEKVDE